MAHRAPPGHLAEMNISTRPVVLALLLSQLQAPALPAQSAMHGIAKDVDGETRPYITAGDRAYLIGPGPTSS